MCCWAQVSCIWQRQKKVQAEKTFAHSSVKESKLNSYSFISSFVAAFMICHWDFPCWDFPATADATDNNCHCVKLCSTDNNMIIWKSFSFLLLASLHRAGVEWSGVVNRKTLLASDKARMRPNCSVEAYQSPTAISRKSTAKLLTRTLMDGSNLDQSFTEAYVQICKTYKRHLHDNKGHNFFTFKKCL